MKKIRWISLGLLLVLLCRTEHTGAEMNRLEPVETILLTQQKDGSICVETDTGAKGIGMNPQKAVENLHSASPKVIFLDTAQYLLVDSKTKAMIPQMYPYLRPATRVCQVRGEIDISQVTEYLKTHTPEIRLLDLQAGCGEMQTLYYKEGRGQLVNKRNLDMDSGGNADGAGSFF